MAKKKTYEGMFLLDAGTSDFAAASESIRTVLARSESEILSLKPWDERRLAYDLKGRRRALYVLTYFEADPARIVEIEHDCRLNEQILRVLILLRENLGRTQVEAHTPATAKAAEAESRAEAERARQAEEAQKAQPAAEPAGPDPAAGQAEQKRAPEPAEQDRAEEKETAKPPEQDRAEDKETAKPPEQDRAEEKETAKPAEQDRAEPEGAPGPAAPAEGEPQPPQDQTASGDDGAPKESP